MQYATATSIKILDLRPCISCILPYYRKRYRSSKDPHRPSKTFFLMADDPPEPMTFLGSISRVSRIQQQFFWPRSYIHRILQKPCEQDPGSTGPSTNCRHRIQDPSRSRILDPGSSMDLGTCLKSGFESARALREHPFITKSTVPKLKKKLDRTPCNTNNRQKYDDVRLSLGKSIINKITVIIRRYALNRMVTGRKAPIFVSTIFHPYITVSVTTEVDRTPWLKSSHQK